MALMVFTSKINERIKYAFEHIFINILGVDIDFCTDFQLFEDYDGPKVVYGDSIIEGYVFFKKHSFLDEEEVKSQNLSFATYKGFEMPFAVSESIFDFDVFAASFYFLSRYEEYTITERDEHLRFSGKSSLAYKNNFIKHPIIDEWAFEIAALLNKKFETFIIKQRSYQFIPTLDIDRPFYYRTDSFLKKTIKIILTKFKKDPFDVYSLVKKWDKKYHVKTIYFFLVGNKHINDVAPNTQNKFFRKVLRETIKNHEVGIHPSYFAFLNPDKVIEEKQKLSQIIAQKIEISRQHYLLLSFPKTYKALIKAGIKKDYTLAFADVAGFRASTCTPFRWYNLQSEKITDLQIYPTAVMDQTLRKYSTLNPEEALVELEELINNVKKVNGTFISLWHNESVSDFKGWKGWQAVYLKMLSLAAPNNYYI